MENLETQERVINLGKILLSSLKENEPDEISAWMINYLAEKIVEAENGNTRAKENCVNVILQLWENRSLFPSGTRPFENFEPIFSALESLSPETASPRYFNSFSEFEDNDEKSDSHSWIELAMNLDSTARTIITFMFERAIDDAKDEKTLSFLKAVADTVDCSEYDFVVRNMYSRTDGELKRRIENLERRINQLTAFEELCKPIRLGLEEELSALKKSVS